MKEVTTLTYKRIESIKPPKTRSKSFVYDSAAPGLRVKTTRSGHKAFQFYSWDKKRQVPVTITIATYNGRNLDDARKVAKRYAAALTEGRDIVTEQREFREEKDFDFHFNLWIDDQRRHGRRDIKQIESRYKNHVLPTIGHKKISWFSEDRLNQWLLSLPGRASHRGKNADKDPISRATANRCLQIIKRVFNHRTLKHIDNPAKGVEPFKETSRARYVKPDEMRRIFDALPFCTPIFADIVLMALYTGARKQNLLTMRWQDLDLASGTWTILGEFTKNGDPLAVPLLDEAVDLLKRRKVEQKANKLITPYVFPGKGESGHLQDIKRQWSGLKKKAEITTSLRFHDLRRSVGSYMAQSGQPLPVIAAILGHKDLRTTEIYARLNRKSAADGLKAGLSHMLAEADKIKAIGGEK